MMLNTLLVKAKFYNKKGVFKMKVIDETNKRELAFGELEVGSVFYFRGFYFLKTHPMFLVEDVEDCLCDDDIRCIDDITDEHSTINAINLSTNSHCQIEEHYTVELVEVELHIKNAV